MRSLVLVRHGDDPPDDRVVAFAVERGLRPVIVKPFRGEPLGEPDADVAGTVIYGGPFNVFEEDRHPFLDDEARWIRTCMAAGIPVLGICQGAQQIARILGAEVGPKPGEPHEFGYYRISPTPDGADFMTGPMYFTESHFHTFDIPRGAVHLAGSDAFANQAFRYGDCTYALQFHPEVTHTACGAQILRNFLFDICHCAAAWRMDDVAARAVCAHLARLGFGIIDCQMETPHLASLGARPIARRDFVAQLDASRSRDEVGGNAQLDRSIREPRPWLRPASKASGRAAALGAKAGGAS